MSNCITHIIPHLALSLYLFTHKTIRKQLFSELYYKSVRHSIYYTIKADTYKYKHLTRTHRISILSLFANQSVEEAARESSPGIKLLLTLSLYYIENLVLEGPTGNRMGYLLSSNTHK